MKTITKIASLLLLIFVIHFHCVAQDFTHEQEVFLKFLSISIKDKKIKALVYPAKKNYHPKYSKKDIYILDDNGSILTGGNQRIIYSNIPLHFLTVAGLFFYNISCYINVDEFNFSNSTGTLIFSIIGSWNNASPEPTLYKFEYIYKNRKWRLVKN